MKLGPGSKASDRRPTGCEVFGPASIPGVRTTIIRVRFRHDQRNQLSSEGNLVRDVPEELQVANAKYRLSWFRCMAPMVDGQELPDDISSVLSSQR